MNRTTTRLNLSLHDRWRMHEARIANMAWAGAFVTTLLLIHRLLSPAPAPAAQPIVHEQLRPAMLIATATAGPVMPTATPWPTPEPVIIEVPIYQEPQVIYVEVPAEAAPERAYAPPTMPPVYEMDSEPQAEMAAAPVQWATSGPVRKEDFKEPDPKAKCLFVGCL